MFLKSKKNTKSQQNTLPKVVKSPPKNSKKNQTAGNEPTPLHTTQQVMTNKDIR
jgi:hypothetical protein